MKRFLVLVAAACLLFPFTACNTGNETGLDRATGKTPGGGYTDIPDIGSILGGDGSTDVVYGQLDDTTKQRIISDLEKGGYEASFGEDGSMTIVNPTEDTTITQKPDGTWVIKDADGNEGQIGGDWPDNKFTKLVPKPDFELHSARTEANSFTAVFKAATIDQMKAYAAKVKEAGFNIEVQEQNEVMGMEIYTFEAKNAEEYTVEITCADGQNSLTIRT